jgi:hypothetical protein
MRKRSSCLKVSSRAAPISAPTDTAAHARRRQAGRSPGPIELLDCRKQASAWLGRLEECARCLTSALIALR